MQPNITPDVIKVVQTSLNLHYKKTLKVDGKDGPKTQSALKSIDALPHGWGMERRTIGYIQHVCDLEDINAGPVDGYWGPQTAYGYGILADKLNGIETQPWREDEGTGGNVESNDKWPLQTQEALEAFYGPVGENMTKIRTPYTLKIAWDTAKTVSRFTCHRRVHDSLLRVLTNVKNHYGQQRIESLGLDMWGGCLNVRKMRGGSSWSTHSWGMAIDWDPTRNQLRWNKTKAQLALPEYEMWWKFWEDEGWVSLGRERDYDWMHVQAARIKKR